MKPSDGKRMLFFYDVSWIHPGYFFHLVHDRFVHVPSCPSCPCVLPVAIFSYIIALSSTDILSVIAMRSWALILLMSWPAILVAIILSASDILSNMAAFSSFDILSSAIILSLSDMCGHRHFGIAARTAPSRVR